MYISEYKVMMIANVGQEGVPVFQEVSVKAGRKEGTVETVMVDSVLKCGGVRAWS